MTTEEIAVIGGGIGGLTTALALHQRDLSCRVYESTKAFSGVGAGISILPHGARALSQLGVLEQLATRGVEFKESCFFTGFGQLVLRDPARAGHPQLLVHRADLHAVLTEAVEDRLGPAAIETDAHCVAALDAGDEVQVSLRRGRDGPGRTVTARAVIACDGIHSAVRKQFNPQGDELVYSGNNMWRGLSRRPVFLSGGSHVRIGSLRTGKLVVYPVRNYDDGTQLVNWVAELAQEHRATADWSRRGRLEDFSAVYESWHFDWLDVPSLLQSAEIVLEYPMSDRDPLTRLVHGRIALLGDAAHPMLPRGSNGAMQSVLDALVIAEELSATHDVTAALRAYESRRLPRVNEVVMANRTTPPDMLIETVHLRSGDRPFRELSDVIDETELRAMLESYKTLTGYDAASLAADRLPI